MKKIHKAAIIAAIVALFLIILGISISEDYESPKERLYKAIRRDDLQTVKNVIEKYPELIDEYENSSLSARIFDTSSDTPLGEACKYMKVPIIQYLVESGVYDIDAVCGSEGETALICAAKRDNGISAIKVLLDHGADKTIKDDNGKTAYDYAVENGNTELAEVPKY